ncbi:MAG: hypothetical protein ACXVVU_14955, partial [Solirubrobacteraceae bacterium]
MDDRRELFEQVTVNPDNGGIEQPADVDLDPEVPARPLRAGVWAPHRAAPQSASRCRPTPEQRLSRTSRARRSPNPPETEPNFGR